MFIIYLINLSIGSPLLIVVSIIQPSCRNQIERLGNTVEKPVGSLPLPLKGEYQIFNKNSILDVKGDVQSVM